MADAAVRTDHRPASTPGEQIRRRPPSPTTDLSFAQLRLWFLDQLVAGSPFYTESSAVRLHGPIDVDALERSINEIVTRHEVLRTTFHEVAGRPVQVVEPHRTIPLDVVDLRSLDDRSRRREVARRAAASARQTFDLRTGPLLRTELLRVTSTEWVLLFAIHHIACDGWSTSVFSNELAAVYRAFAAGRPSPLPPPPIQYADFAHWQRATVADALLERQVAYWRDKLADLPALELPSDRGRPARFSYEGDELSFDVPLVVVAALRRLSQQEGATLFMTLLTGFVTVLHRHARQDDMVVGCPIANRTRREIEGLIGFFVNTLVFRIDAGGRPTFRELLARVRRTALEAFDHQDVPFEQLVDELHPDRDLSRNPLFQVIFQLRSSPGGGPVPGGRLHEVPVRRGIAKFDLRVDLVETLDGLDGMVEYSTDLFDRPRVERLVAHLQATLAAMARRPDDHIDDVPLVGRAEAHQLAEWGRVLEPSDVGLKLWPAFEAQVALTPDAVAVVSGATEMSYAELHARAAALVVQLDAAGVVAGELVGVGARRRPETIVAILAIVAAGAAYVPLDAEYPDERLGAMVAAAGIRVVLTDGDAAARFGCLGVEVLVVELTRVSPGASQVASVPSRADGSPEDPAYVMFTSGSTGEPKGVVVPHRGVLRLVRGADYLAFGPAEVGLLLAPLTFDAATLEIWGPLLNGGRLAIAPEGPFDPDELAALVRRHGVTTLWLTAGAFHQVVETRLDAVRGVRQLLAGGDVLHPAAVDRVFAELPGCRLVNGYGPTENTTFTTCHDVVSGTAAPSVPIGRPIHGTHVVVVDESLRPAPLGVPGELCIGGDGLAWGYLGDPRLTAERFVPNPFVSRPGARMYRSGDLVVWNDRRELRFLGRMDRQLKVRGFRVEPGEIEAALSQHPLVDSAVVVGQHDGGLGRRLVAYVVPSSGESNRLVNPGDDIGADALTLVGDWQRTFDGLFAETTTRDARADFRGWTSSATGAPIPEREMKEWLDASVQRILALRPRRVLEIGVGTGLVLFRVAPTTERYVATDLSPRGIERLRGVAAAHGLAGRVELACAPAHDLGGVPAGEFDLVILNSVIQYFPSVGYLDAVLVRALRALAPGGAVFVGDVRSLPLLDAFHVELARSAVPRDAAGAVLAVRARRQRRLERELVVDPGHFDALVDRDPRVGSVGVELRRGAALNEMARFRYDVVISTAPATSPVAEPVIVDWEADGNADGDRWTRLDALLAGPRPIVVRGVLNKRVAAAVAVERLVSAGGHVSAAALNASAAESANGAVDPERFHELAAAHGVVARVRPAAEPDRMDLELVRAGPPARPLSARAPGLPPVEANEPLAGVAAANLGPALRQHLAARLPDFMIPATFVVVDAIPLTPNGKVDRAALPMPDDERPDVIDEYVAPRTANEAVLAEIWADVIGIDRVGVHDNFFELGGDSILCLQIIARARAAGLSFTVLQLFEHQTVAELVELAGAPARDRRVVADQQPQTGAAALTPVQRWLLEDPPAGVDHFNQSVLLEVPAPVDANVLARSLAAVAGHHDALRLRFRPTGDGWEAAYADASMPVPVTVHDLTAAAGAELGREIERRAALAQAALDITRGPLLRAELYRAGARRPARLLLAAHHLVVDGVSWRFLLEDLWIAYRQVSLDHPVTLPAKTSAIGRWADAARAYADDPANAATAAAWAVLVDDAAVTLPTDGPVVGNVAGAVSTVTVPIPASATARLLREVPRTIGCRVEDVLIASLARALAAWCGRASVAIDVEGHGREEIAADVDVTRTVGWFTAIAPARLTVDDGADLAATAADVAAQLRARPGPGQAFAALRYLSSAAETRELLGGLAPRQLSFNYLGQFGGSGAALSAIRGADEDAGPMRDPRGARRYLVEIDAVVNAGELTFTWTYCRRIHRRETIAGLAERVAAELVDLPGLDADDGDGPAFPASPLAADELASFLADLAAPTEPPQA